MPARHLIIRAKYEYREVSPLDFVQQGIDADTAGAEHARRSPFSDYNVVVLQAVIDFSRYWQALDRATHKEDRYGIGSSMKLLALAETICNYTGDRPPDLGKRFCDLLKDGFSNDQRDCRFRGRYRSGSRRGGRDECHFADRLPGRSCRDDLPINRDGDFACH